MLEITIRYFICSGTLVVGSLSLFLGIVILLKNTSSALNRIFSFFCIGISIWLLPTSLSTSKLLDPSFTYLTGKIVYSAVIFLPTFAYHFALEYVSDFAPIRAKRDLFFVYMISYSFLPFVIFSKSFITGTHVYWWGFYPKTGSIHLIHCFFLWFTAFITIRLIWRAMQEVKKHQGRTKKYYEYKYLFLAFLFMSFSSTDILQNWGVNFPPVGFIFVGFFVASIAYAIFKHELLGIQVVIKSGLIYSALLSFVGLIYFLSVYVIGSLVGGITPAQSTPITLLILSVITLLFKPIEAKVRYFIDSIFFKKSREDIERENELLHKELQNHNRMKSIATLAAGMAHEIKNPLTSIKTFAEHLPKKYDDPDFREKFSRIVVDEVDRVNNIVKQLLEFSKPSSPDLKPVLIGDLLDQTLGLINNNMIRHHIDVTKELDMFAMVSGDRNQLRQAFLNLFLNAIQSMTNGGKLHVSAHSEQDGKTRISITDTGCGMSTDQAQHAFDPFFTTKEDGTGLGLAIVHSIITKHGGKIEIKSKVGDGTTVNVFLKSLD